MSLTTPRPSRIRTGLRIAASAVLLSIALAYLWSTLATVANFAFRYPAFDQYRLYAIYLGLPFPENAMQLENGHRPILPALVRLAEIRWFEANQGLQIAVGLTFALLALALLTWATLRERSLDLLQVSTALLLSALGVFWLGNARLLMHGNELVHVYLVVLLAIGVGFAVHAARAAHATVWMAVATACAVAASFSFGSGLASFPALLLITVLIRIPLRALILPLFALSGVLISYLLGLPGNSGVRNVVSVNLLGNLDALVTFLSSPWMNAWLGMADPPLVPGLQHSAMQMGGGLLVASAGAVADIFGEDWMRLECRVIGAAGVFAWLMMVFSAWRIGPKLSRIRLLAVTMSTFGAGVAAIVSFTRLQSFLVQPTGILADRYLPWSCLFWLGLALYWTCAAPASLRRQRVAAVAAFLGAFMLFPSHRALAGWSATVHRHIQQSAVAAQLGIWDDQRFPDGPDASKETVVATLALLRRKHLSMFSEPVYRLMEEGRRIDPNPVPILDGAFARVVRRFHDPLGGHFVVAIEGWIPKPAGMSGDPVFLVVDATGTVRGAAKPSHMESHKQPLRMSRARQGGYDGYILDPMPNEVFHVLVLSSTLEVVASVPLVNGVAGK